MNQKQIEIAEKQLAELAKFPEPFCKHCTLHPAKRAGPYARVCYTCWQCRALQAFRDNQDVANFEVMRLIP